MDGGSVNPGNNDVYGNKHDILSFNNLATDSDNIYEANRRANQCDTELRRNSIPDEHRVVSNMVVVEEAAPSTKMSSWKAAANFICDIEGVGLLSLPYAILKGGLGSIIALVVMPPICYYTGLIMIKCLYEEGTQGVKIRVRSTVEDLGEACLPKYGKKLIIVLQNIEYLMVSTSYLVLSGSFLTHALPKIPLTERMWIVASAAVVLPTIFLKSLSKIAWVSLLGVLVLMVPIGVVLWHGFLNSPSWKLESVLFWDGEGFALAFGIIVFSYSAHSALPRLEGCMSHKESFSKVLGFSFLFVTLIKIVFTLTAFLTFVGSTQEVIVNNFPVTSLFYVVLAFLCLNVLCSYPFPIAVVIQTIDDSLSPGSCLLKLPRMLWFVGIRIFLLLVTLVTALFVPHFALLLAFFGSMISSSFSFVFPCFFHLKLKVASLSLHNRLLDYIVILLGVCSTVLGTVFAGKALVEIYNK